MFCANIISHIRKNFKCTENLLRAFLDLAFKVKRQQLSYRVKYGDFYKGGHIGRLPPVG
jgi:hypothetical protein